MGAGNIGVYDVMLAALSWAFSFWMVADSFRRRASFCSVPVILLGKPPLGGLAYLLYVEISDARRARSGLSPVVTSTAAPPPRADDGPADATLEIPDRLEEQRRFAEAALIYRRALETGRLNHRLALAHYSEQSGQTARAKTVLSEALAAYERSPAPEQIANRRWQRRIVSKLEELAAG